ncbi:MAG: hypothetical protein PF638_15865 [Candidatus Delongbacteria bacterium]|jgi:hypothetical protein|nr:hypothetical protein [Candidatus Delongbacteria bacterium]
MKKDEDEKLVYEDRLVAFIDILGFKELVKQSEEDPSKVESLYSALKFLKNWEIPEKWDLGLLNMPEDSQCINAENFGIGNKTNTTTFSDSIFVSVKIDNDLKEVTSTLIANLAYMGAYLVKRGILFRGGLSLGKIIHKDNGIVFGQGLIDAWKLESNNAKYPRIILSDKLIKELNYPIEAKGDRYPYHYYIDRFEDGCVGFHQMIYYQVMGNSIGMSIETLTTSLDAIRKVIIEGLDNSFEKIEVFEKYKWLKEKYNQLIFSKDPKNPESIMMKIRELNENIAGKNIHYSYTDNFYERIR